MRHKFTRTVSDGLSDVVYRRSEHVYRINHCVLRVVFFPSSCRSVEANRDASASDDEIAERRRLASSQWVQCGKRTRRSMHQCATANRYSSIDGRRLFVSVSVGCNIVMEFAISLPSVRNYAVRLQPDSVWNDIQTRSTFGRLRDAQDIQEQFGWLGSCPTPTDYENIIHRWDWIVQFNPIMCRHNYLLPVVIPEPVKYW